MDLEINEQQMPNCKYDDPGLCEAQHIKKCETLAQIARSRTAKQKAIFQVVIHMPERRITERRVRYKIQHLNIDYKTLFKKRRRRKTQDVRHWALGTGRWALGTGHWALGTEQVATDDHG
jgi:hypothetical protein